METLFTKEIPSDSKPDKTYTVSMSDSGKLSCTCPHYIHRRVECKHIKGVLMRHRRKLASLKSEIRSGFFRREEIGELLYVLTNRVFKKGLQIAVAGSYRRGKEWVRDLDILALSKDRVHVVEKLTALAPEGHIASGDKLVRWEVPMDSRRKIQLDFYFCLKTHFESMLLFLTGGQETNIRMRSIAKARGFKLNQYGLWDRKDGVFVTGSEWGIFEKLGLPYIPPEDRK